MLADSSISEFSNLVSKREPTPGGGSVSAAAGAIGAALGAMAARFSDDEETAKSLDGLRDELLKGVDEDAVAYGSVNSSMALPKKTDDEKKSRKKAMQNAFAAAGDVPLRGMVTAVKALELLAALAPKCSPYLASDLRTASGVLFSAVMGCREFVLVNAGALADKDASRGLLEDADRLITEAARHRDGVLSPGGAK